MDGNIPALVRFFRTCEVGATGNSEGNGPDLLLRQQGPLFEMPAIIKSYLQEKAGQQDELILPMQNPQTDEF